MSCVDLLGRRVRVVNCGHKTEGLVVGESRNAIYILKEGRVAVVPKAPCYFLDLDELKLVKGAYLLGYRDVRLLSEKCLFPSRQGKRG